ncbi:410_t:CDS:2, partial [Ambispora gerdemannii]
TKDNSQDMEGAHYPSKKTESVQRLDRKIEQLQNENKQLKADLKLKDQKIRNLVDTHTSLKDEENEQILSQQLKEFNKYEQILKYQYQQIQKNEQTIKQQYALGQNIEQLHNEKEQLKADLKLKDQKIQNLVDAHTSLKDEAAKYQLALGEATNFRFGDHDLDNVGQLINDIKGLKRDLEMFCSLKRTDVNEEEAKKLLNMYGHSTETMGKKLNKTLIQGVLQQHIIKTVIQEADKRLKNAGIQEANEQFQTEGKYLEANLVSTMNKFLEYMDDFSKYRVGTDEVIHAAPTRIRQLVYAILSNRGFETPNKEGEHPFIAQLREKIVEEVNRYRTIKKPERKTEIELMVIVIIRQIISIFCFRLKVQEPVVECKWYEKSEKIEPEFMEVSCDENELEKIIVNVCSFPLIGTNLSDKKCKVFTQASVIITNREMSYD